MSGPIIIGMALRDDDAAPLALGRTLARLTDAPLALATSYPFGGSPLSAMPERISASRDNADQLLDRHAQTLREEFEVSVHVCPALSPTLALIDLATDLDAAAIVVGSTHRGTLGRVLAGDVSAGLMHGAPCPVIVAPRGYTAAPDGLRRIGVGFVDTPEGCAALDTAVELAEAGNGTVAAFTVLEPITWAPAVMTPGWSVPRAYESEREAQAQEIADMALRLLTSRVPATSQLVVGVAAQTLATASEELDLLVCGSRGYGAVRSVLLGSVSRQLTHSVACPLLVVPRPPHEDVGEREHDAHGPHRADLAGIRSYGT